MFDEGGRGGYTRGISNQELKPENMEPKFEQPKQYTSEEIAEMEKSRTISDAELLIGGAEYSINEKGEKENLLVTEKQKKLLQ